MNPVVDARILSLLSPRYIFKKVAINANPRIEYMIKVKVPEIQKKIEKILKETRGVLIYQEQCPVHLLCSRFDGQARFQPFES